LESVDSSLARALKPLRTAAQAKARIDANKRLSPEKRALQIADITAGGATFEDLSLDFTLPGYPNIELIPGGSNVNVTVENVGDFVSKVIDFTLGQGVRRQVNAFRVGFSQVFPYSALQAFTPDELVMLFGRVEEDWTIESKFYSTSFPLQMLTVLALMDSIKADHGFNLDSKSVRNLLQVMSDLDPQDRRDFLQFVTGSPKLPIGG
jgi:E3 ubiquitin-protein ligase TRIP12